MKPFPDAVRSLRGNRSQEKFAAHVGVTRNTVCAWERGSEPSIDNLRALVDAGLNETYLRGTGSKAAPNDPKAETAA